MGLGVKGKSRDVTRENLFPNPIYYGHYCQCNMRHESLMQPGNVSHRESFAGVVAQDCKEKLARRDGAGMVGCATQLAAKQAFGKAMQERRG